MASVGNSIENYHPSHIFTPQKNFSHSHKKNIQKKHSEPPLYRSCSIYIVYMYILLKRESFITTENISATSAFPYFLFSSEKEWKKKKLETMKIIFLSSTELTKRKLFLLLQGLFFIMQKEFFFVPISFFSFPFEKFIARFVLLPCCVLSQKERMKKELNFFSTLLELSSQKEARRRTFFVIGGWVWGGERGRNGRMTFTSSLVFL